MGNKERTSLKPEKEFKKLKILVACEESQVVTKAFRKKGHEAYSCDTIECSGGRPEWHLRMDVIPLLRHFWDMIIAFPLCTYLCSSGMHWTTRGLRDPQLTVDAVKFAKDIWSADCEKIVLENSIGCLSREIRKPDQIIQPNQFGHDASKATCIWLKGVDKLEIDPLKYIEPRIVNGKKRWGNQTDSGQNKLLPSKDRARLRAETYQGIADAMADQWG